MEGYKIPLIIRKINYILQKSRNLIILSSFTNFNMLCP